MAAPLTSWLAQPGPLRALLSQVRLASRLLREPRVPLLTKAVPLLAALYLISPIDFIPDILLFLGQFDDLGIALVALAAFRRLCPKDAVAFHGGAIAEGRRYAPMSRAGEVIDAEWRRE
jgi:uncharacterized membrane protein YkvA (DUF1232 family)